MVSDFIKGRKQYQLPTPVVYGIKLHRAIDWFTDSHQATHNAKEVFKTEYRLYAGAFVDVVYDHFLANDAQFFSTERELFEFAETTYANLTLHAGWFPPGFNMMVKVMSRQNWLYHYRSLYGVEQSFNGLVRRSAYMTSATAALKLFHQHYDQLAICYRRFIAPLDAFVKDWSITS